MNFCWQVCAGGGVVVVPTPAAEVAHEVSVVAQVVTALTDVASSVQVAAVWAQVTTPEIETSGRVTPMTFAVQVAAVCPHWVTAAGVVAAAMQLFRVVSHALTALMSWPTTAGRTDWAWVTAQD